MSTHTTETHADDKPAATGAQIAVAEPTEQLVPVERAVKGAAMSLGDLDRAIAHYPELIRAEVAWLQGFFLDHCKSNKSALRVISEQLKMEKSEQWFSNLMLGYNFTDRYASGVWKQGGRAWSECVELIAAMRRYALQIEQTGRLPFVRTPTYHCISDFITARMALAAVCKIGGITGPTGGQKSACYKNFRLLNNHGRVIHIEAPADGRLTKLQAKIATAYHVTKTGIRLRREDEIRAQVNETRCIIIDNAQELYQQGKGSEQPAFNWLR